MAPVRRAVIDIGTNSIKLLVGDVTDGVVRPVEEKSEQTRLGAGFYETHELQSVPIQRTAAAVARFVAHAGDAGAQSIRAIATSAARDARNADELIGAIRRVSSLRVEVISGAQEAQWVYLGVTSSRELHGRPLLILDVGGGSTEFILGNHGLHSWRESFPLGSVRLLEELKPSDPPSPAQLDQCRAWLVDFLERNVGATLKLHLSDSSGGPITVVGTGGTTTILARMAKKLEQFDRDAIEGTRLSLTQLTGYMTELWEKTLAERKLVPGLPPNRADVIIMGVAIYEAILRQFRLPELYVSTRGLRFGALIDMP